MGNSNSNGRMSSFSSAVREFQDGNCSINHLETQIERDIALGSAQATELLDQLTVLSADRTLNPAVIASLRRCIEDAETRRRTQLGGATAVPRDPATPVFSDEGLRSVGVGDVINGRFILEEEVGSGGMSQVFRATDKRRLEARSRDPVVALKIMKVQGVDPSTAFVAMQREAQKSQQLLHQNILRVNDFDRDGSVVYTTMEFLHGESLQQKIARAAPGCVPLEEAVSIINSMADALAYAHDNRIIHADFKPSNVFITRQGVVKVIDFGIARAIQAPDLPEEEKTVFDPRAALGALTPAYASPEMLEDKEPDTRDDIYALGCVAYELLTGRHPYSRLRATDARDGGHPLKRPDGITDAQWLAIRHALEFEREDRTASVREFLQELNRLPLFDTARLAKPALAVLAGVLVAVAGAWFWSTRSGPADALVQDCATCPRLLVVPAGSSPIGLPADSGPGAGGPGRFEHPVHTVVIGSGFALGTREVSVAQFRAFVEDVGGDFAGCRGAATDWQPDPNLSWENPGFPQSDDHPVTCVSWNDAAAYAAWLSERTGRSYRLPSETEWEYTARTQAELPLAAPAGEGGACPGVNVADQTVSGAFGDLATNACRDGYVYTAPVDRHDAGQFADLRGNVFEWTQDCWNASYRGAPVDGSAWQSGDCGLRVLRGGSWYTAPNELRLTYRNRFDIDYRSNTFGFRIARDLDEPTT